MLECVSLMLNYNWLSVLVPLRTVSQIQSHIVCGKSLADKIIGKFGKLLAIHQNFPHKYTKNVFCIYVRTYMQTFAYSPNFPYQ